MPVLGSIPGLGMLFRNRTTSTEKQNLMVFLRPTVLKNQADIAEATERKFNRVFELEIEGEGTTLDSLGDLLDGTY